MRIGIPVDEQGQVYPAFGRAVTMALADVTDGEITQWRTVDVGWDVAHDEGTHGAHHARIARFLLDNEVDVIAAAHIGPGMVRMLGTMKIPAILAVAGDARDAALKAAQTAV